LQKKQKAKVRERTVKLKGKFKMMVFSEAEKRRPLWGWNEGAVRRLLRQRGHQERPPAACFCCSLLPVPTFPLFRLSDLESCSFLQ
jgi:hypothetical protein